TGKPPYPGPSKADVLRQAAGADLADAYGRLEACGADAELVRLAKACLSREREDRPRDAGAVARAVVSYQAGVQERLRQVELERAGAQARAQEARATAAAERRARRRMVGLAAVASVLLLAGVSGGWWVQQQRQARQAEAATRQRDADQKAGFSMDRARGALKEG